MNHHFKIFAELKHEEALAGTVTRETRRDREECKLCYKSKRKG